MITTNLDIVIKKISNSEIKLDAAAFAATEELKKTAIELIKSEIKGTRPKGQKAVTGQPPMNRTGKLRASVKGEATRVGFASYGAIVGPTVGTYARAVEVGNPFNPPTWTKGEHFPYVRPAYIKLKAMVPAIIKRHF
jgi:hypothetical protein